MRKPLFPVTSEMQKANTEPLCIQQIQFNLGAKLQYAQAYREQSTYFQTPGTTADLMSRSRLCLMTYLFHISRCRWNKPARQSERHSNLMCHIVKLCRLLHNSASKSSWHQQSSVAVGTILMVLICSILVIFCCNSNLARTKLVQLLKVFMEVTSPFSSGIKKFHHSFHTLSLRFPFCYG